MNSIGAALLVASINCGEVSTPFCLVASDCGSSSQAIHALQVSCVQHVFACLCSCVNIRMPSTTFECSALLGSLSKFLRDFALLSSICTLFGQPWQTHGTSCPFSPRLGPAVILLRLALPQSSLAARPSPVRSCTTAPRSTPSQCWQ